MAAAAERWSRDAGFERSGPQSLLFPRGVEALVEALRAAPDLRYVLTGSLAAQRYEPHAPARFAMVYADDVGAAIERLGLRRVETGANVLVAPDRNGVGFLRAQEVEGVHLATPSQIAVDLLTGPGRSPSEGAALLDWMEAHEPEWRDLLARTRSVLLDALAALAEHRDAVVVIGATAYLAHWRNRGRPYGDDQGQRPCHRPPSAGRATAGRRGDARGGLRAAG